MKRHAGWKVTLAASSLLLAVVTVAGGGLRQVEAQERTETAAATTPRPLTAYAQVTHPPLGEISGIVKSRRYPDTYWVHNDSGDVPRIYAIRADGTVIMPSFMENQFFVGSTPVAGKQEYPGIQIQLAENFDWEDIAIDGDTLYIADVGNNGNARRDLGVYVVTEPNPAATGGTRILKWLPVAYSDQAAFPPPQWHFDCEAVFTFRGKLYFVTKHRAGGQIGMPDVGANLYRLDTAHTDRVNTLTKVDGHPNLGGWVTAADLSPDGKTLAVLCQAPVASVWLFDAPSGNGDRFLSSRARRLIVVNAKQAEAITFDGNDGLIVANEQRDLFRLSVRDFAPVRR